MHVKAAVDFMVAEKGHPQPRQKRRAVNAKAAR